MKTRKPVLYLATLLFLFCKLLNSEPLLAQIAEGTELQFAHLSVREGLSQSSVLSIHQDPFGFIWIGTRDGLNKYDGYTFEVFRHSVGDSLSIAGNIIHDIQTDQDGNIWVATEDGLSKYDRRGNIFENYSLPKPKYETSTFQVLLIDKKGNVWVGGRYGLFLFDEKAKQFHQNFIERQNKVLEPTNFVSAITEDDQGNIWVGATRFGIFRINRAENTYEQIPINFVTDKSNSRVEALLVDEGQLWAGTYGNGLYLIDYQGRLIQQYRDDADARHKITHNNIRSLLRDEEGKVWVGTFDGLNILTDHQVTQKIFYREGDTKGLSHSSVRALLKDQKGTIWVGTYFGGLSLFDENNQRFQHFYQKPFDATSLSYNVVGAFAETPSGDIIIGTERGGINVFRRGTNVHVQTAKPSGTIKSLLKDPLGQVWVGVFREGLNLLQKNNTLISYPNGSQEEFKDLKTAIINTIVPDSAGGVWLGTDSKGGLYYFDNVNKRFKVFNGQEELQEFLGNYPVKSLLVTQDDKIILATKGRGVVVFDKKTATITQHDNLEIEGSSVLVDDFNHVFEDQSGMLWLASNGAGVFSFDRATGLLSRIHAGDGLTNNIVMGTMQDTRGYIWFVTLSGLNRIDPKNPKALKTYRYSSGFPLEEINEGAFFKTQDGLFLIGGNNGYALMDPQRLKDNSFVPPIALTNLSVSNKRVLPGDETGILERELHKTKSITLSHAQSIITIDFAALNFIMPENNQYAYKLEGFDEDWIYSDSRRSVTYTSLPDGKYTFMVKGANNDGIWNEQPLELAIIVQPPLWRSWWAFIIYGSLIIAGFLIIRYNAIKSTQLKNNLRFEQMEKEKWKEIHDLKLMYFIDVSHEFRTPLTLILNPLEEIISSKVGNDWLRGRLKIMLFNAKRLLLLIDQILEIRELEAGHHIMQYKQVFLSSMMNEIIDSFKSLADQQLIRLEYIERSIPEIPLMIDQDKMQKVLFNLLSNAFKFTPPGGHITVKCKYENAQYHILVKDTGSGIAEADLPKVFDRFYKGETSNSGAGIGLSITKLLVEAMGGTISVKSKANMGTTFEMLLSFQEATTDISAPYARGSFRKPVPLEYEDALLGIEQGDSETAGERPTVLVVEDNSNLRSYLVEQLSMDYEVVTAPDGAKGLRKARKVGPAIIVSDVMMPGMDGYDFCRAVKTTQELCHIPVILLTAKNSQIHRLEGLEYGADDYIGKPFSMMELKARIKNILQNRKVLQEKYRSTAFVANIADVSLNSYDEKLLAKLHQVLTDNLDQSNLTVEYLGDQLGLSRVHLFRKLKALTGLTPSDFIKDFRIKNAQQMLESGKFRVADVAGMVGFQDVQYFRKVFKKETGVSPSEYGRD